MHVGGKKVALALPVVLGVLIAITVAAVSRAGGHVPPAAANQPPAVTKTVLVVGDSVAKSFGDALGQVAAKYGYAVVDAARGGCPATGVGKVHATGVRFKKNTCPRVVTTQDAMVETYRPALVLWWSRYELAPRLGADGKLLPLGSRAYERVQQAAFESRVKALTKLGARLVAVQIEPPGPDLAVRNPPAKYFLVGQTLLHRWDVVRIWNAFLASHKGPTVFSISIRSLVCHDAKDPCDDRLSGGEPARPDGVHYSETARQLFAPSIFEAAFRAAGLESALTR